MTLSPHLADLFSTAADSGVIGAPEQVALSFVSLSPLLALVVLFALRRLVRGPYQSDRAQKDGGSALLPLPLINMFYWGVALPGDVLISLRVSANSITWMSLLLGVAAGVAVGAGQLGMAACLCMLSAVGDALDGYVARASGEASDAGEVLDAAVDRVTELSLLAGAAVLFRTSVVAMVLSLLAILACFMVSYTTAKSEALRLVIPRGTMRRGERAALLTGGALLTPPFAVGLAALGWPATTPLLIAVTLVASLGNLSWIRRTSALYTAAKQAARPAVAALPKQARAHDETRHADDRDDALHRRHQH